EQAPRAGEPARRLGVLAVDAVLAREIRGEPAGAARVAAALRGRVGLPPPGDPGGAAAPPPQRLPEPVERVGVVRIGLERRRERVACARPVRPREALPAVLRAAHGDDAT